MASDLYRRINKPIFHSLTFEAGFREAASSQRFPTRAMMRRSPLFDTNQSGGLILPNIVGGIALQPLLPGSQVINEHTQISRGAEVSVDAGVAKATILTHKPVNSSTEVHIRLSLIFPMLTLTLREPLALLFHTLLTVNEPKVNVAPSNSKAGKKDNQDPLEMQLSYGSTSFSPSVAELERGGKCSGEKKGQCTDALIDLPGVTFRWIPPEVKGSLLLNSL
ncbi:hypothetical protein E5288_WYG011603 [Bos mutus]|uniref:Uncharacterized protein n=1 Tax=Bos mutus TaxID=72004 RepID=A0A6B0RHW0_9CETA|nr:hypothetical protein [Bos mutus]